MSDSFSSFLEKYKDKKLVLTTHRHPDVDGIASMYALSKLLKNADFALQDKPSDDTLPLIEKLGIKYSLLKDLNKTSYEGLVVLDCHSYVLLKDAQDWNLILIIDHHENESKTMHAEFEIIQSKATSNAEVIFDLIKEENINKEMAFALAVAIISDTARFKSADASTFLKLSKLIEISKSTYKELFRYAYPKEHMDKRKAVLMALQRTEFIEYKGNLIATSHVGTSESTAATLLSDVADYVFISSEKHDETRTSARAGEHSEIPINEVMFEVGKILNGAGGGHEKAAGASTKADLKTTLQTCIEVLKRKIDQKE